MYAYSNKTIVAVFRSNITQTVPMFFSLLSLEFLRSDARVWQLYFVEITSHQNVSTKVRAKHIICIFFEYSSSWRIVDSFSNFSQTNSSVFHLLSVSIGRIKRWDRGNSLWLFRRRNFFLKNNLRRKMEEDRKIIIRGDWRNSFPRSLVGGHC